MREWLARTSAYWMTAEVTPDPQPDPSVYIDLLNLEWWQALIAIIGLLGLSPAPWLLGLATGKIQFTLQADAQHGREISQLEKAHAAEIANLKAYHQAVVEAKDTRYADLEQANQKNIEVGEAHRARADAATAALSQAATAIEASNHIIEAFTEASKEVGVDEP